MTEHLDDQVKVLVHRLEEGDMLVVNTPHPVSRVQRDAIVRHIDGITAPLKVRVLIMDSGTSLEVMRSLPTRAVNASLDPAGDDVISAFGSLEGSAG